MDRQTVFTKTAKGMMEATGKTSALSRDMRTLLKEIDGKATFGEVHARLSKVPEAKLQIALQVLVNNDFIREFKQSQTAAPPPTPPAVDIDLDFTTAIPTISALARKAEEERQKARAAAEASARAQAEAAARAKAEAEPKAKAAAARAKAAGDPRAKRGAEEEARKEPGESEREALELFFEQRERQEAEERARREAEERARREAEERARIEAEEQARREAEELARAQEEARREAEEVERKAREAAERERQEAEERARREAEERARIEAEEAERKAREAAERERQEAEERARREAEERARREAEELARAQEEARREAEEADRIAREAAERERQEAEERARREAEERARIEAEEQARVEAEEAERRAREEAERKAREAEERERQEAEERAKREAEERARREAEELARAQEEARRETEEAERKAREAAKRERQDTEEQVARESAQPPQVALDSSSSLDEMIKIETDFDAVLRASAGEESDAARMSAAADDKLRKEAEEQSRKQAEEQAGREAEEARAREEADAAAKRAEEEREEEKTQERTPDEAGEPAQTWDHAEAQALLQAQDAETERHFAEMEKELEAEQPAATGGEKPRESREHAREREKEEARASARAAAAARALAAEAAREAEAAAEEAPARIRVPVKWGRPVALTLFLILFLGLLAVPFVPFDGYIPQFQKLAGTYLQQPVKIKSLHLMLLPQPHWRLDDVSVGNDGQLTVSRVNAIAELGSMFSEKKVFKSIELESPVLSEEGLLALLFGKPLGQDLKVARVTAKNGKLDSKTFSLPAMDATIRLGEKSGTWETIVLETPDHNTRLRFTPDGVGAHVEVTTNAFSMPLNPAFVLENFDATGVIRRGELTLSKFNGGMYGGSLSGSAVLKWGADWSLSGEIRARAMDPGALAPQLIKGGSLAGKAAYAMQGKSYAALFAAPHLEGSFAVARGMLLGVELGRFLQGGGVGGKTGFAELSGNFVRDAGKTQLRQIHLVSGPLSASGNADADVGNRISGRFLVELKSDVAHVRANLGLSGALGEPHFSR